MDFYPIPLGSYTYKETSKQRGRFGVDKVCQPNPTGQSIFFTQGLGQSFDSVPVPLCRVVLNALDVKYDIVPVDVKLYVVYPELCILTIPVYLLLAIAHEAKKTNLPRIGLFVSSSLFSSGSLGRTKRGLRYNCRILISYSMVREALFVFFEQTGCDQETLNRLVQGIDIPFDNSRLTEGKLVETIACVIKKNSEIKEKIVRTSKIIENYKEYELDGFFFSFWGCPLKNEK